jgi:hypothetical protein
MGAGSADHIRRIHYFDYFVWVILQTLMDCGKVLHKSSVVSLPAKPLQAKQRVCPDTDWITV